MYSQPRAIHEPAAAFRAHRDISDLGSPERDFCISFLDYLRATGVARLDPDAAQAAALAWMHQADVVGTAVATTSEVTTTVTIDQTTKLFSLVGIDTITVEASSTARPRLGVTEPIGGP